MRSYNDNDTERSIDESRRSFIEGCGFVAVAAVAGVSPILEGCDYTVLREPPLPEGTVAISVRELVVGGHVMTEHIGSDGKPILVVRPDATRYLALSTQCKHQGCPVWPPKNGEILCPCHGSRYTLDGTVKPGSLSTTNLDRYPSTYEAPSQKLIVTTTLD